MAKTFDDVQLFFEFLTVLNDATKRVDANGSTVDLLSNLDPTGNTNTRGFFEPNTKEFIKKWVMEGPTHHYALGIGHHAKTIAKIAEILGIEAVIVK